MIVSWESMLAFVVSKMLLLRRSFKHHWKTIIVFKSNEGACHSGGNSALNFIRLSFWIIRIRGKQTMKKLLKSCFICKFL